MVSRTFVFVRRFRPWVLLFFSLATARIAAESIALVSEGFIARDDFSFDPTRFVGGLAFTPEGDPVVFDGASVTVHGSDGDDVLTSFDPPVFGSFMALSPDRTHLIIGESSDPDHFIYTVPLGGGARQVVDRLRFNYAVAHDAAGNAFVSAPDPEFITNQVYLLDHDPDEANPVIVEGIPGFSGPLAFDQDGNLYCGTAGLLGSESIVRFSASQVATALSGETIAFDDGVEVVREIPNINNMIIVRDVLFFTDVGFSVVPPVGRVVSVDLSSDAPLAEEFVSFPFESGVLSATYLAFQPGSEAFAVGSGADGGRLIVAASDFATTSIVTSVEAEFFFLRGEVNRDGIVDISDAIFLLRWLFLSSADVSSVQAADVNADGDNDIADPIYLLDYLFVGGPAIPQPFPNRGPAP